MLDWHARYVLSGQLSNTLDVGFCRQALADALRVAPAPYLFNSDASDAPLNGSIFILTRPTTASTYFTNSTRTLPTTTTADPTKACMAKPLRKSLTKLLHSNITILLNEPR